MVCDVLDALAVNLDGSPAAPDYFSRRRRVLHKVLGYAVRKKRLGTTRSARATCPRAGHRPNGPTAASTRGRRHPGPGRRDAGRVQLCRPDAGAAVRRVLRLHVLRA